MSIIRTRTSFERDFTMTPNTWVRDERLTLKARGLLTQILSHSAGWEITIESLARVNPEGRDSIRAAIKELEDFGYLRRERARGEAGKFGGMDYHLSEPETDYPTQVDPNVGGTRDKEDHLFKEDHPSVPSKPAGAKKATQLPRDWNPTDEHKARADKSFLNLDVQAEKFRLHAAEHERKAKNWNAAFTRWLINAEEYRGPAPKTPAHNPWSKEAHVY